jgi:hypothetical protein
MLGAGWERESNWRPEELGAILRHQLAAPIEADLPGTQCLSRRERGQRGRNRGRFTFGGLLHHALPQVELLRLVKEFAKAHLRRDDGLLPREIAHLLYYASLTVAQCRCGRRISRLSDAALIEGIDWVLSQGWVDAQTRGLFLTGRGLLQPNRG